MVEVIGVSFDNKKIYYFSPNEKKIKKGTNVIVETEQGLQFGTVMVENFSLENNKIIGNLKPIVRIATKDDLKKNNRNIKDSSYALKRCRNFVGEMDLNMKVLDAHFTFDRSQLIFRFLSDTRIDFRELAKRLAAVYKTRIELRQIGVRDKSKEYGGIGTCGNILCCTRFLKDFDSVSINMAKNQGIALNPTKINGLCGRLLCCLRYEDDCYTKCKKELPKIGDEFSTASGTGKVTEIDIFKRKVKVDISGHGIIEVDVKDDESN